MFVDDARAPASGHRISAGAVASWLCADACDPGLGDVERTLDADRALSSTPRTSDGSSRNGRAFGRPTPIPPRSRPPRGVIVTPRARAPAHVRNGRGLDRCPTPPSPTTPWGLAHHETSRRTKPKFGGDPTY